MSSVSTIGTSNIKRALSALGATVALSVTAEYWTREASADPVPLVGLSDLRIPGGGRNAFKSARDLVRESFERVECLALLGRVEACDKECNTTREIARRTGITLSKEEETALITSCVSARAHSVDRLISLAEESQERCRYHDVISFLLKARVNCEEAGLSYSPTQEERVRDIVRRGAQDLPLAIFDNDYLRWVVAMGSVGTLDTEVQGIRALATIADAPLTRGQDLFLGQLHKEVRVAFITQRVLDLEQVLKSNQVPALYLETPALYFVDVASGVEQRAREAGITLSEHQRGVIRQARLRAAQLKTSL